MQDSSRQAFLSNPLRNGRKRILNTSPMSLLRKHTKIDQSRSKPTNGSMSPREVEKSELRPNAASKPGTSDVGNPSSTKENEKAITNKQSTMLDIVSSLSSNADENNDGDVKVSSQSQWKTWEGFIGGGFATVAFGKLFSFIICRFQYFVCPIQYSETLGRMTMECEPSYLFTPQEYSLGMFGIGNSISIYPFVWHSISLSLFSSIIGPFGGFFASGFNRAFKIKDFGDMIPGHGGIMDRFDCQFIMATFVYVYISSFIRTPSPAKLLTQIYNLKPEQHLQIFNSFRENLDIVN